MEAGSNRVVRSSRFLTKLAVDIGFSTLLEVDIFCFTKQTRHALTAGTNASLRSDVRKIFLLVLGMEHRLGCIENRFGRSFV